MTTLTVAAVVAFGAAGILMIVTGYVGVAQPLDALVADLHRRRSPLGLDADHRRLAGRVAGPPSERLRADLTVLERDGARWLRDRLTWAAALAMFAAVTALVVPAAAGAGPAVTFAVPGALVGAVGGWFYAVVDLRSDAAKARRGVRHAVASYLELVTILMAGGSGPESAMFTAAEVGRGQAFRHLRASLVAAQVRQEPPWALLAQLGRRLGVNELVELGASMTLAGGGAQVKDTLAAKAASIRVSDLARIESEAQARSETMALPVVMMFTGFLLLLGYPALAGLTGP